jgi:hypothetical protein
MIKLEDVIECLELDFEESAYYYHVASESIIMLTDEEVSYAENEKDPEDAPEWQRENILLAYEFYDSSPAEFISLPDRYEVNEYQMMERFIMTLRNEKISDKLWNAINGRGAFRNFRYVVDHNGLQDEWYNYREAQYKEIAIAWCEENKVEFSK